MNRKLCAIFVISQMIGVGLALYLSRFQVGVEGVREFLWMPATFVLLPGILFGYAANELDLGILSQWYAVPFFAVVVLLNAICWNIIAFLIQRRQRRVTQ
jgi:hypothetical protein